MRHIHKLIWHNFGSSEPYEHFSFLCNCHSRTEKKTLKWITSSNSLIKSLILSIKIVAVSLFGSMQNYSTNNFVGLWIITVLIDLESLLVAPSIPRTPPFAQLIFNVTVPMIFLVHSTKKSAANARGSRRSIRCVQHRKILMSILYVKKLERVGFLMHRGGKKKSNSYFLQLSWHWWLFVKMDRWKNGRNHAEAKILHRISSFEIFDMVFCQINCFLREKRFGSRLSETKRPVRWQVLWNVWNLGNWGSTCPYYGSKHSRNCYVTCTERDGISFLKIPLACRCVPSAIFLVFSCRCGRCTTIGKVVRRGRLYKACCKCGMWLKPCRPQNWWFQYSNLPSLSHRQSKRLSWLANSPNLTLPILFVAYLR